jgi:hypothetical protein
MSARAALRNLNQGLVAVERHTSVLVDEVEQLVAAQRELGCAVARVEQRLSELLEASEQRQREFAELLRDVDDESDEDSALVAAAVGAGVRAAMHSQRDHEAPNSRPPGDLPWWARALPARLRWLAAVVALFAALAALAQALAALRAPAPLPVSPSAHSGGR